MEQDDEMSEFCGKTPFANPALHPKVILHIDIDYYYAQVEEVLDPDLKNKPFGIKQRFHIVTSNYIARERGIKKMELTSDALKKCPELVIINGEDLTKYKTYSKRIAELLHSAIGPSERMGLDEHFLDITKQVEQRLSSATNSESHHMTGPIFPNEDAFAVCSCGCAKRLSVGSEIAKDIRQKLLKELKLTCSVGIAHNKLLAKLVGNQNKPDNQTTLAPLSAQSFMASLENIRSITGIGGKTASRIEELGVKNIEELQNCDINKLRKTFGADMATRLKQMAMGDDPGDVKPSGKPKTVGLEDSCRPISIRSDAQEKFRALLPRLVAQIQDDGRIPQSIKVTVRKYDPVKKSSVRETKQCALPASHFSNVNGKVQLLRGAEERILRNVMTLFDRIVDLSMQFNITLLGLCFSKFLEQKNGPNSVASFLMKKRDVEVQSITNLSNENASSMFVDNFRTKTASPSSSIMDYETMSNASLDFSGSEESELEPSPKKRKRNLILSRSQSHDDPSSPNKLNVHEIAALHLNGSLDPTDKLRPTPSRVISPLCFNHDTPVALPTTSKPTEALPNNVDPSIFSELPPEVQQELLMSWQPTVSAIHKPAAVTRPASKTKAAPLHKYFIRNS